MAMSFMEGLPSTHLVVNSLYDQFVAKDIKEFDGFNVAILDTFNTINMALPGKHYVAPSYKDVKDLFEQWKQPNIEDKKKKFTDFINKNTNLNKVDESMLITAIMAPPAAMVAKKTGQIVPQLAFINVIPDVVFVPSATLLALIAVKIIKLTFIGKTTSNVAKPHVQPTPKEKHQMKNNKESQTKDTESHVQPIPKQKVQSESHIQRTPENKNSSGTIIEEKPQPTSETYYCALCKKYHSKDYHRQRVTF
ncbi:hypothetical protein VNO78_15090 [Psophocarpus tetragonolobus]|uniref:Uncharacterized protein n=1 Tax=Psophocarpus tetragonolobus TaxID=3891 RepID=A0AAN9XJF8_PSOTE